MALLDLLSFVTDGAWGTGLARPITAVEADENVYSLADAIQDLIDNPIAGVSVSNIAVVGRQVTFYMTDATTYGPFNLPIAQPRYRGYWAAAEVYYAFDIVTASGYGTYMVALDHTAAASFDPDASGTGGAYYVQIGPDPYYTSQVFSISDTTLTLTSAHQNKYIRATNASGLAVTLNADVFPLNAEVHFRQTTTGPITVTTGAGVSINVPASCDVGSDVAGAVFTLKQIAANEWDIFGNLAAATA